MMKSLEQMILDKIREERIVPLPRWYFLLHRSFVAFVIVASLGFSVLASGVLIFELTNGDWDLLVHLHHGLSESLLFAVPVIWLVLAFVAAVAGYWNFRRTRRGYRRKTMIILGTALIFSVAGGALFDRFGFAAYLDQTFSRHVSLYGKWHERMDLMWTNPDHGFLSGTIVGNVGESSFVLIDPSANRWTIDIAKANWRGRRRIEVDHRVRIIGTRTGAAAFVATEIRPWPVWGRRRCFQQMGSQCSKQRGGFRDRFR